MTPRVYAFDVDETLELSGGPVLLADVIALRGDGHIVGLCGNWGHLTHACRLEGWHKWCSFIGPMTMSKAEFLGQIKSWVPASDYVLVGNDHGRGSFASPDDASAARDAEWRFISEAEFAAGER